MNGTRLPDGDDQARDFAVYLAAWMAREAPPRARTELLASTLARTATIAGPRPSRWPAGRLLRPLGTTLRVAFVALLVVALSSAAIVGSRLLLPTRPVPTPAPNQPSLAPSTAPTPLASPVPLQSSSAFTATGGATIADVTPGGSGLLAVGSVTSGNGEDGAAWTSSDGSGWTRVSTGASLASGSVLRIAGRGSDFVALGVDCPPNAQRICGWGQAWTSPDGARWTAAATSFGGPSLGGLGYGFQAIVQGGPGYVMVGGADQADPYGGTYLGPVIATSKDGLQWTIRRLTGQSFDLASFAGIASGARGFVAVGATVTLGPAIWISPDGTTWRPVSTSALVRLDAAFPAASLDDVAASPGGYVMVGREGPSATAWVSRDGTTWSPAHHPDSFGGAQIARVVWTGSTFLAMGRDLAGDGAAWVSTSGFDWTPIDTAATFRGGPIVAGAQIGQRIVLFGGDAPKLLVVAWAAAP